ncbi:hypothetical protein SAMN05428989_1076 [Pseudoxanthomonas sp. GM95]|uniref:hypothetical protein n=1 Tax=Pseudoxanthomonas sp. GM95 TaxID=1881043 RepID=UPI0008B49C82|nr:hypothetical protein [Pseudoxanthomonas sp. GM95]SEK92335.1 hypothetical protein SAMN05428989_1076 [Pseudoxanthomonas sp. GM95]
MRRSIVLASALLASALTLPALAQTPAPGSEGWNPDNFAQAKAQADRDEASLPADVSKAMRMTQQDTLEQGIKVCATPNPDTSPFVLVARLDARGTINRIWRSGSTPLSICMEKYLRGRVLMVPVRAPFYVSYELSFAP